MTMNLLLSWFPAVAQKVQLITLCISARLVYQDWLRAQRLEKPTFTTPVERLYIWRKKR